MLEKLLEKLDSGEVVIFTKNGEYNAIGGAGKDKSGDYRCSGWCVSKKNAIEYLGCFSGYLTSELQVFLKECTYVESFPHAYGKPVKKGTRVLILSNAKEECEKYNLSWDKEKEEMVGKIVEVRDVFGSGYEIWNEDKSDSWAFPRTAFVIAWDDKCPMCGRWY